MPPVRFIGADALPGADENFQRIPGVPLRPAAPAVQRSSLFPQPVAATPLTPAPSKNINDPHHYANSITGNFLGATLDPFLLIQRNDVRRNLLGFRNTNAAGGADLYVDFGKPPSAQSWLVIPPTGIIMFDAVVPQDDVWVNGSAVNWSVAFIYSTIPNV